MVSYYCLIELYHQVLIVARGCKSFFNYFLCAYKGSIDEYKRLPVIISNRE